MNISKNGIDLIKKFEGVSLKAYKPVPTEKYYTIGYGHYGSDVEADMKITIHEAENLLKNDLLKFEKAVNKYTEKYNFTQNEFDALVSFAFNCGIANLNKLTANGTRTMQEIADAMLLYNKAGGKVLAGLTRRRNEERILFLTNFPITEENVHIVKKGETLWSISQKYLGYGVKWRKIADYNGIVGTVIKEGMALKIPPKGV